MKNKKRKTMNVVLIILFTYVVLFTICMIVCFWVKGSVPDTLIQYTLGSGGIECLAMAGIKITKTLNGERSSSDG